MTTQFFIMVGLSGGVDSAVTAYLLKQQGYQVEGLFMKNWEEDDTDTYCSAKEDRESAASVCETLNIPFHTVNFAAEYWDQVFEHFLIEYKAGRTPNPDILCNREIKFKAFLDYAKARGASHIATGHYAQIFQNDNGEYALLKGIDPNKDQSYFLHALNQTMLSQALFPIGHLLKTQVREIAKQAGLSNYNKKDSTGICFIGERKFKDFLIEYLPAQPGDITNTAGTVLGRHDGLMFYTLGQRQGLSIGGLKGFPEKPWYVSRKNIADNILVITQDEQDLLQSRLHCVQVHWISGNPPAYPLHCTAKIRYRQLDEPCIVTLTNETTLQVDFERPQRAVTPGQSIVFYDHAICLGGGIISNDWPL